MVFKADQNVNTSVNLGGINMKNPVTTASGTFGFGFEYQNYVELKKLGAITVKGTTLKPRLGNPPIRIAETPAGMLNAIGLQNPGVEVVAEQIMPRLAEFKTPIIVNIAGETADEYAQVARRLDNVPGVSGLEVNISCPNVKKGGLAFGSSPETAAEVTRAVREETKLPMIIKLSPNVSDITAIAQAVVRAGADALSMINTLLGMVIDVNKRRPLLGNVTGGLSGPAVRPVAVRCVWQVHQAMPEVPILGMGGIMNARDALEFILAGATAVAVGTANFINPKATIELIEGIEKYMAEQGFSDISELLGLAQQK